MTDIPTRTLGRTGLTVTLLGLGAGGNSRLGLSTGQDERHAADVVRAALDLGLTLIDTARAYGTEKAVGLALKGRRREGVTVSSKSPYLDSAGGLLSEQDFERNIDATLQALGLETVDIYFIHGLRPAFYEPARERFLPVLEKARQAGKIRFVGITEAFETDTRHEMLVKAVQGEDWDVMMVGYNLLNPSARERVLKTTIKKGIGTLGMFAVRRALVSEGWLRILLGRLAENGEIDPALAAAPDLMDALSLRGTAGSFSEAAYRFCAFEPSLDAVLVGTGNADHLRENLTAVLNGPLPRAVLERFEALFGNVDSTSGQVRD